MQANDPSQKEKSTPALPSASGSNLPDQLRIFTTPLTRRGWPIWLVYLMSLLGLIYILNPTLGILEFIPDNLPIIGNLDEGVAFMLLWFGVVQFFEGKNKGPEA
jgi:hypothetical protein